MNQIIHILAWNSGLVLFVAAFAEQSGVPIPAAPILLAAGALAAAGQLNLFTAIAWTALACLAADTFWFYAGHRGKDRLLPLFRRLRGKRHSGPRTAGSGATLRGLRKLTVAKFLPLGSLVPLRAGTMNISPLRFVLLDLPASLVYGSVYPLLGFFFHRQLDHLTAIVRGFGIVGALLILLLAAIYASFGFVRRRRVHSHSAEAVETANSDLPSQAPIPAPIKNDVLIANGR